MAKKQTKTSNEITFKCEENGFTKQEYLRWSIAREIMGCDDAEKLHIIDTFVSRYLSK